MQKDQDKREQDKPKAARQEPGLREQKEAAKRQIETPGEPAGGE
jgi:hypothetical protein